MASETILTNTNLPNNSSFWQLNSDCLNYNLKTSNSQNFYPTYQTIPTGSNLNASNFNVGTKNVFYYPAYNSEIQESTIEDYERLRSYHYPHNYSIQSKDFASSTYLANSQIKPLFNPIYQNNFYEPKDNQSSYINGYGVPNEIYLNQHTNEQKWPFIPPSDSSHYGVANFQNFTPDSMNGEAKQQEKNENNPELCFSDSSQDSSSQSVKNESFVTNGAKTDLVQVKSQNSNQKKTRTKDKYRVVYNDLQRSELEKEFNFSKYITSRRKSELAGKLDLSQRQNRRAKDRKMSKKKKSEQNSNESIANSISRQAIQNGETSHSFQINGLNNFEPKQFVWQNDQNQARAFADINGHLNIRPSQTNSSEFFIYNQTGLNY